MAACGTVSGTASSTVSSTVGRTAARPPSHVTECMRSAQHSSTQRSAAHAGDSVPVPMSPLESQRHCLSTRSQHSTPAHLIPAHSTVPRAMHGLPGGCISTHPTAHNPRGVMGIIKSSKVAAHQHLVDLQQVVDVGTRVAAASVATAPRQHRPLVQPGEQDAHTQIHAQGQCMTSTCRRNHCDDPAQTVTHMRRVCHMGMSS